MDRTFVINDVREKEVSGAKPPSFPQPTPATTGFPEPKKRTRVSAFKQKRLARTAGAADPTNTGIESRPAVSPPTLEREAQANDRSFEDEERARIDKENKARIESMSPEEVEKAQQELLNGLDPSIIQMLLRRANLDEQNGPSPFDVPGSAKATPAVTQQTEDPHIGVENTSGQAKEEEIPSSSREGSRQADDLLAFDEDAAPLQPPADLFPVTSGPPQGSKQPEGRANTIHFPQPPQVPDLDPTDPDFLANLHQKYFPNLAADPAKLAWMAPIPTPDSIADRESPYYPGQTSLPISALRFDFRGALLPPHVSRTIPTSLGLHHHGEAPEAAGYTVAELAWLARSAVPAQRCLAFQTLGRIAFRLGRGEWGGSTDDLAMGIWSSFQQGRVLDSLNEAATVPDGQGHRGSKAYAIEALWLLEKGGWKEKWRGR